jgi:hypothetical protein
LNTGITNVKKIILIDMEETPGRILRVTHAKKKTTAIMKANTQRIISA